MDLYLDPLFYSIDLFVCFCARANLVLLLSFCSIIYTGPGDSFNSVLFVQNIVLGVSKVHSIWILRCVFFLFFYFYFFNLIFLLFLFFLFLWRIESMFFYLDCIEVVDCVQSFPWQVSEYPSRPAFICDLALLPCSFQQLSLFCVFRGWMLIYQWDYVF